MRDTVPRLDADATRDSLTVSSALTEHYRAHGLPMDGGAQDPWFRVRVGAATLKLPNPPSRRRAVFFHDVNHVLTGYDTTLTRGELSISAFEVGCGCGPYAIAWFINLYLMALGVFIRPRAVLRAFVHGRRSGSIYRLADARADLQMSTVAALRARLDIAVTSADGPATSRDIAVFTLWTMIAIAMTVVVTALPFAVVWGVIALVA